MKKSKKLTGILLACCALLMVAIAGLGVTLAKYTKTAPENGGTAHVAAFGVSMEWGSEDSIFKKEYTTNDSSVSGTIATSVKSSTDVIAPGTTGSVTLTFEGSTASEVAFNLKINISETYSNNWTDEEGNEYHPINYTVSSTAKADDANIEGITGSSIAIDQNFAAGTVLSGTITITWSWPFNGDDAADTHMGGVSSATYSIVANATVTQID